MGGVVDIFQAITYGCIGLSVKPEVAQRQALIVSEHCRLRVAGPLLMFARIWVHRVQGAFFATLFYVLVSECKNRSGV